MKTTKLLSLLVMAGLSTFAFADSNDASTTTPQQQAQLDSLNQQISQLQNQLQGNSSSILGKKVNLGNYVMLDTADPFGLMSDTIFPLQVLQAKQSSGFTKPLVLGGYIEADAQTWDGNLSIPASNYKSGTNIYITTAKLFALGNIGDWVSTFASFQPSTTPSVTTTFDQAFITVGNLNKNPLYLMIGESYLPFGTFAGNAPWSNSITTNDFRTSSTNQINLGYYQNGLQLNLAVANSPKNPNTGTTYTQNLEDFIYDLNYGKSYSNSFNYSIGASYMSDIRGMNNNVGSAYSSTLTGKQNGAWDVNGSVGFKQVSLNVEYDSTTSAATNLNGSSTGVMSSWMTTLNYAPVIKGQVTIFSVGYSQSKNMANVPYTVSGMFKSLPATGLGQGFKQQWIAFVQRPIVTNVYLGPEFDYAKTYNGYHTWTGTLDLSAYF